MTITNNTNNAAVETTTSAIEAALDKITEASAEIASSETPTDAPASEPIKVKRPRLTDEEREARRIALETERAIKREARAEKKVNKEAELARVKSEKQAARDAKKAAKAALPKKIPHLAKVEKAANLPEISDDLKDLVGEISDLSAPEISAVMAHLSYAFKVKQTVASNDMTREVGETVKIIAGNADVLGLVGTVSEVHRIRAFVKVPGVEKPIYVYMADLESAEPETTVSEDVSAEAV